jgi:hypothetical protein
MSVLQINVFQWIFVAFCGIQFCISISRFRYSRSAVALLFAAGWLAAVILLLIPTLATQVASLIGIGRGADFVLYTLSFVFMWAHYQHYLRYRRTEESLTLLVRELAIANGNGNGRMSPGTPVS